MGGEEGVHGRAAIASGGDGPGEDEHQRHAQVEEPCGDRQPPHPVVHAVYPAWWVGLLGWLRGSLVCFFPSPLLLLGASYVCHARSSWSSSFILLLKSMQ